MCNGIYVKESEREELSKIWRRIKRPKSTENPHLSTKIIELEEGTETDEENQHWEEERYRKYPWKSKTKTETKSCVVWFISILLIFAATDGMSVFPWLEPIKRLMCMSPLFPWYLASLFFKIELTIWAISFKSTPRISF